MRWRLFPPGRVALAIHGSWSIASPWASELPHRPCQARKAIDLICDALICDVLARDRYKTAHAAMAIAGTVQAGVKTGAKTKGGCNSNRLFSCTAASSYIVQRDDA